jgi:hypothetical protein
MTDNMEKSRKMKMRKLILEKEITKGIMTTNKRIKYRKINEFKLNKINNYEIQDKIYQNLSV